MTPSIDLFHGIALAIGAVAAAFFPKLFGRPRIDPANAASQHPLFATLLQVLESKLTDLIQVEPGESGEPIFTIRVVLSPEQPKK